MGQRYRLSVGRLLMASSFQFVHGTGIFLRVLQSAMPQKAGNGFNVGSVVEDVHSKGVASTMPINMFVDTSTFYPPFHRFTATLIRGKIEYRRI